MIIRPAREADRSGIAALLRAAFASPVEAKLVERLRADGHATIELVAEAGGAIVGHILFSPVTGPFRALALAPVAVLPDRQGHGIGSALIEVGHRQALAQAWEGVFVLGEPGFYRRFGYSAQLAKDFASPYAGPCFQLALLDPALSLTSGTVDHAPAFAAL